MVCRLASHILLAMLRLALCVMLNVVGFRACQRSTLGSMACMGSQTVSGSAVQARARLVGARVWLGLSQVIGGPPVWLAMTERERTIGEPSDLLASELDQ